MKIKLTKKQIEILKFMDENEEDILCSGNEVWYGDNKTNNKLLNSLLRLCLIKDNDYNENSSIYYTINGDGIKAYKEGYVNIPDEAIKAIKLLLNK